MASKFHAKIVWETLYWENFFWLQDVGSCNGTFLNGFRLSEKRVASPEKDYDIRPNDKITIGDTSIAVYATLPPHLQHLAPPPSQEGKEEKGAEGEEGEGEGGVISSGFQPNLYHPIFKPLREYEQEKAKLEKKRQLGEERRALYLTLTQEEKDHKRKLSQSYIDRTQERQQWEKKKRRKTKGMNEEDVVGVPSQQSGSEEGGGRMMAVGEGVVNTRRENRGGGGNNNNNNNKALRMLRLMGWKEGEGLGPTGEGMKEPLPQESNEGTAGLGFTTVRGATPTAQERGGGGGRDDRWSKTRSRYQAILEREKNN